VGVCGGVGVGEVEPAKELHTGGGAYDAGVFCKG
jgi:hypothetical protein